MSAGTHKGRDDGTTLPLPMAEETLQECRRCDLWRQATQAVAGEGPVHAPIMLVGEQPGNDEDLQGHPFVGPAGQMLEQCFNAAALSREEVYLTNAVKHFKWEPRGKRRLHRRPDVAEINACNVWLEAELARVAPRVVVALGATALRALLHKSLSIVSARTQTLHHGSGTRIIASYHPSAILRAEGEQSAKLRQALIEDLKHAREIAAR